MDVWIVSTKNTVSNKNRIYITKNVDNKPFPILGKVFLYNQKTWNLRQYDFQVLPFFTFSILIAE